jgi:glycerophosphoryl diester phosphodiesterase
MRNFHPVIVLLFLLTSCVSNRRQPRGINQKTDLNTVLKKLHNLDNKTVLISAHRGDWRNAPENSLQGLKNCIEMGVDIVEFDLKQTKDGHLIVMHDDFIDRTTTGKGKPENYTLVELKQLKLRDGAGHSTAHTIPTLEEYLTEAKEKIVICVDKSFPYFEQAMASIQQKNMAHQVIYNIPNITLDSLKSLKLKGYSDKLMLNVLRFPTQIGKAEQLANSYSNRKYAIMHPTFTSDTIAFINWMPTIKQKGLHLWVNALWPEHNGGHNDDVAVDKKQPDESWGWLVNNGATIIQTDRPFLLLQYLKDKGWHP